MAEPFFVDWMDHNQPVSNAEELVVLREKASVTKAVHAAIKTAAMEHLVGLDMLKRIGGWDQTEAFIRNKVPTDKKVRSGDLGEILASEYIDQCMSYAVPIKRLRWKDDRDTTMRGNDVLALSIEDQECRLLKAESKSRASLQASVVEEAVVGLAKHRGRPNPSSLAFISSRLREQDEDGLATVFERLQSGKLKAASIEHLVFTFSGNDPTSHLEKHIASQSARRRHLVGCHVAGHQEFIKKTFEALNA